MSTNRDQQMALAKKNARRKTTPFREFAKYEEGRNRSLRFDVNALADFEQETGMGFAQLMKQRAIFANARAMLWAGLKHEDRGITIEYVGDLINEYLTDEDVPRGDHTIDTVLMAAFDAAIEQGALGLTKKTEQEDVALEQSMRAKPAGAPTDSDDPNKVITPSEILPAEDPTTRHQ